MAFNFGQHVRESNDSSYVEDTVAKKEITDELIFDNNIYTYIEDLSPALSNGTFMISCFVNPLFDTSLNVKIYLIDTEDNEYLIKEKEVEQGVKYFSALGDYAQAVEDAENAYNEAKDIYDAAIVFVKEKNSLEIEAAAAYRTNPTEQNLINLTEAQANLQDAITAKNGDEIALQQASADYALAQTKYNEAADSLWIEVSKAIVLKAKVFKGIKITFSHNGIDLSTKKPKVKFSVIKVKELLNNNVINQQELKRVGIQAPTGTKVFINDSEIEISSTNILEIEHSGFVINSLKIIPNGNFFIIDYAY